MGLGNKPWVRAGSLLFSAAVVCGLLGFAWDRGAVEGEAPSLEELSQAETLAEPPAGPRRSAAEVALVQRATAGLPPYKDAVPHALANDYLGANAPMAVAWFATRDSPDEVLGYYRKALSEAGFLIVEDRSSPLAGYVGYVEPRSQQVHLISVLAQGGETTVFASSGRVGALLEQDAPVPDGVPHPEDAEETLVLSFKDEGLSRESVVATAPTGTVEALVDFYQRGFAEKGWRVDGVTRSDSGEAQVQASRSGERATALIRRLPGTPGVRLYITITHRAPAGHSEQG